RRQEDCRTRQISLCRVSNPLAYPTSQVGFSRAVISLAILVTTESRFHAPFELQDDLLDRPLHFSVPADTGNVGHVLSHIGHHERLPELLHAPVSLGPL